MDFNLAVTLRESARRVPGKPVMVQGETRTSYAELDALSDRVAANLAGGGLAAGDRVGLQLRTSLSSSSPTSASSRPAASWSR